MTPEATALLVLLAGDTTMSGEEWRSIIGFPGYEVSNLGRVASHRRGKPRVLRPTDGAGYAGVTLYRDGIPKRALVHRLVAEAFHPGPRSGNQVRHLDGAAHNNRADNLTWGTASENERDKLRHGTNRLAARTHCKNSHPYDESNTSRSKTGARLCLTCHRQQESNRRARRRAASAFTAGANR